MNHYRYLIIGGGMTADAAAVAIRNADPSSRIGIFTSETYPPYNRPPLSKALWKGDPVEKIWRQTPAENVDLHLSTTITQIDPLKHSVVDDKGGVSTYDKLLLATGGTVRRLPWNVDGIIYFRTFDDYRMLRETAKGEKSFIVIGGGFIGSEIAAALAMNDMSVAMIFPESGIGSRIYTAGLSHFLNSYFVSKGVDLYGGDTVVGIEKRDQKYIVTTKAGKTLKADGVIAGIGIQPDTTLAQNAGLTVENGIVVNEFLQTSSPDIYAAGDVANFFNPVLGKRIRLEHEDNALVMGEYAGRNMAGDPVRYHHLPFFYSDLFDLGYEAVGEIDSRMETVEDWKEQYRDGVVYYLTAGRVHGVLLWNTWGQVDAARLVIGEKGPLDKFALIGRIPA